MLFKVRLRRVTGTLLMFSPLIAVAAYGLSAVALGALGMDIHWTSKTMPYISMAAFVLLLLACVVIGIRLRKTTGL